MGQEGEELVCHTVHGVESLYKGRILLRVFAQPSWDCQSINQDHQRGYATGDHHTDDYNHILYHHHTTRA